MTTAVTVSAWLRAATQALADGTGWRAPGVEASPRREAGWLLAGVLGRDQTWLLTWPEHALTEAERARADDWLCRRLAGEPMAYLSGCQDFWSLPLRVTPATLIPRPDTERLVELALQRLPTDAARRVLDLGTGSGAIALAVASERPQAEVTAIDRSAEALAVARENGETLGLQVRWHCGSWFEPVRGERFDLVVSNPPYIDPADPHLAGLGHEPASALVADEAGLADLRHLAVEAPEHLLPGGWLLLEHGHDQGAAVRALLQAAGFDAVETWQDYGGQDRVTGGRLSSGEEHAHAE